MYVEKKEKASVFGVAFQRNVRGVCSVCIVVLCMMCLLFVYGMTHQRQ